ncbi:MAG: DUF3887 domain-containing protein [Bacteroidales bacterium]|nr:DUF3887 domain-containing protein [Bacteroidales bacterium]
MRLVILLFSSILLLTIVEVKAQIDSVCIQTAKQSLVWLKDGESNKLYENYDKVVAEKLSAETTAAIWTQIESQMGAFVEVDTLVTNTASGNLIVEQVLEFENSFLKYRLSFNQDNLIEGIFFIPYRTAEAAAESTKIFEETKCSFISDGIEFPAILCTPKRQKTKAIIILVHGSGPNDMDETIGPNKIFKQIANKLAAYGIASLRYHKRSYLAQQGLISEKLKTDIDHIVVNDAIAAAEFLSRIDSLEHIPRVIVGHSLGGHMAPRIALKSSSVDAIVMLAANARPLEDLVLEQYKYLLKKDGCEKSERKEYCAIRKKVKNVKKLERDLAKGKIAELPLTNDTTFWLSLNKYKPLISINNLQMPILILQGERDYQVSDADFELWFNNSKKSASKDQTFIQYQGLNHLFIMGEGESYPEEYNLKAEISDIMIKDIADWINSIWDSSYGENKLERGVIHIRKAK